MRVRTGNLTQSSPFSKGLSTLLVCGQYRRAMDRYLSDIEFDLVLYSTPPITLDSVVQYVKSRHVCKTYLLLKDIFPQNAVDLGPMRVGGLVWRYFRYREKRLYALPDHCVVR